MRTGGPAKSGAAIERIRAQFTAEQRLLYGEAFDTWAARFNARQSAGLAVEQAAAQVIAIAEQHPAPFPAPLGEEAERALRRFREKSDTELAATRMQSITPEPAT